MNIDWDEVANEAEDTPATRLANVQAKVDDLTFVYIAYCTRDGDIHYGWAKSVDMPRVGSLTAIGILYSAIEVERDRMNQDPDEV